MARGRRRKGGKRRPKQSRGIGGETAFAVGSAILAWSYTLWMIYLGVVRHVHVHIMGWLLAVDLFTIVLAPVMSFEWWRSRKGR